MIKDLYTLKEIREKIASQNYCDGLLLLHVMEHVAFLEQRVEDLTLDYKMAIKREKDWKEEAKQYEELRDRLGFKYGEDFGKVYRELHFILCEKGK